MGNMKSKIFLAILTLICLNKTNEINSKVTKMEGSEAISKLGLENLDDIDKFSSNEQHLQDRQS